MRGTFKDYLPEEITWFRLPEYLDNIGSFVTFSDLGEPNAILSGGVVWTGNDLFFDSSEIQYVIENERYTAPPLTNIELQPTQPGLDRIDVFAVNTQGELIVIMGEESADPIKPDLIEGEQLEVSFVLIRDGQIVPDGVTNTLIYNENLQVVGGEWNTSTPSATVTLDSTADSQLGTVSVRFNGSRRGHRVYFTNDSVIGGNTVTNFIFRVKLTQVPTNGARLYVRAYNTSGPDEDGVVINDGQYGFQASALNLWQTIIVPATSLGISAISIDRMEIRNLRNNTSFFVDNVLFQDGIQTDFVDAEYRLVLDGTDLNLEKDGDTVSTVDLSGLGGGGSQSWQDTVDINPVITGLDGLTQLTAKRDAGFQELLFEEIADANNYVRMGMIGGNSPFLAVNATETGGGGIFDVTVYNDINLSALNTSGKSNRIALTSADVQAAANGSFVLNPDGFNLNIGAITSPYFVQHRFFTDEFDGRRMKFQSDFAESGGAATHFTTFQLQRPIDSGISTFTIIELPAFNPPDSNSYTKYIPLFFTDGVITTPLEADSTGLVDLSSILGGGGAFEVLNEGNGDGIVKAGRNAANFGNIGLGSVDLSNSSGTSTTRGATGNSSVTMGDNTTASEDRAFAGGFDTVASGRTSFAYGEGCEASGFGAIALNGANFARSYFETTIGLLATDYTPNSTNANDEGDRIFTIGVGTFPANRSDGFTMLKNGNAAFGINNFEANDTGEKLQVNGKIKATDINFTGLPVHADDAAAGVGGLVAGDVYRTTTGELRIKL